MKKFQSVCGAVSRNKKFLRKTKKFEVIQKKRSYFLCSLLCLKKLRFFKNNSLLLCMQIPGKIIQLNPFFVPIKESCFSFEKRAHH